jgi:thymidylate kinase
LTKPTLQTSAFGLNFKPMATKSGQFIVLYGINNLGKTTQAKTLVEDIIIKMGKEAEYLKYAIYNLEPSGPLINSYLRQGNPQNFTAREFQLLQVLNRTQYEPKLKEKIAKGTWVIAEDYVGTGIAWGMVAGIDKNLLYQLNAHLLKENLGILFIGEPFAESSDKNNAHEASFATLAKVNEAFKEIARDFGWFVINANRPKEEVQKEIMDIIKSKITFIE